MRRREYAIYLASPAWSNRKSRYFREHPRVCAGCGGQSGIQLHHRTYRNLGREPDRDLIALCASCHSLVHRYYALGGKSLDVCTAEVVAYLNGNLQALLRPRRVARRVAVARNLL